MRELVWATVGFLLAVTALAQVPVTGGDGATLAEIAGTPTLVTVVLKSPQGVQAAQEQETAFSDTNLRVLSVHGDHFTVLSEGGERNHYRFADVKEVKVQGGVVQSEQSRPEINIGASAEQRATAARAVRKAVEVFGSSNDNQPLKMTAASLMLVGGDQSAAKSAHDYLFTLAQSNDAAVALDACVALWVGGKQPPESTITAGSQSGNPRVRQQAAYVAGIAQSTQSIPWLRRVVQDRSADFAAPAARALALLGDRESIPVLTRMIVDTSNDKGEAAAFGLVRLGGDDILSQMRMLVDEVDGLARFRIARVLYALGDPAGEKLLRTEMLSMPTLRFETALLLAPKGELQAMKTLRERLGQRFEPNDVNALKMRAEAAVALVAADDRTVQGTLVELRRSEFADVQTLTYQLIGQVGKRWLLPITVAGLDEQDPASAIRAAEATLAILDEAFRDRAALLSGNPLKYMNFR